MGELSSHVILGDQLLFNGLDHMRQVSLYNNNYTIYSKIDHCYGWNESLRMLSANLSLVSLYVCVCARVCLSVCMYVHVSVCLCVCMYVHVSFCVYICLSVCVYVWSVCIHVCARACVCACASI